MYPFLFFCLFVCSNFLETPDEDIKVDELIEQPNDVALKMDQAEKIAKSPDSIRYLKRQKKLVFAFKICIHFVVNFSRNFLKKWNKITNRRKRSKKSQ